MNVLFIESHPDDIALSCLGTLLKHQEQGDTIYFVCVSECRNLPRNKHLYDEVIKLMKKLKPDHELRLNLENRRLGTTLNRERMREAFEGLRDDIGMDIVYSHWSEDIHQDHKAVSEETIKTFRGTSILMYENVHSTPHFNPNYYVKLTKHQALKKLQLIKIFKSQSKLYYATPRVLINRMETRGIEVQTDYAEAFIVWRLRA